MVATLGPVFLLMGTPASGKSTVAGALMKRFPKGLHLPVDALRQMVVSGLADMSGDPSPALLEQLRLARESASKSADLYAHAGFAVAVDDFWFGEHPDRDYRLGPGVHRVVLTPDVDTTLKRLYARSADEGAFKEVLAGVIRTVHPEIHAHPKVGWHALDSSTLSVEETVDRMLAVTGQGGSAGG